MIGWRVRGLVLLAGAVASAAAQQPAEGRIQGVAHDSLRGRAMSGAFIELLPGGRQVGTRDDGSFAIGGVAPADGYRLRVMHATLDTLGISLVTPEFSVRAGDTAIVDVAVPSPAAVTQLLCPAAWIERGAGVFAGYVRDPETGRPIDGATVTLVYDESPLRQVKMPVSRVARPDSAGYFTICGLPTPMSAKVQVTRLDARSGEIPVSTTPEAPVALRGLHLSGRLTRIAGRVTNTSGAPIAGAQVQLDATHAVTTTSEAGEFAFDRVPLGSHSISIRKIGYGASEHSVEIGPDASGPVTLVVADFVPTMPAVVTASPRARDMEETGYTRRKNQGFGYYADGDQLDRNSVSLGEALRSVPGIRVGHDASDAGGQSTLIMTSRDPRGCLRFVVDGVIWPESGNNVEKLIRPQDLEAIEMYSPVAVPGEFAGAGRGRCSVLVIWTRHKIRRLP